MGIPPEYTKYLHSLSILIALVALDIYGLKKGTVKQPFRGTDFLAHLGGYGAGIRKKEAGGEAFEKREI